MRQWKLDTLWKSLYIRIFAFFAVNQLKKFVFFVTIRVHSWLIITLFITNTKSALFRNKKEPASTARIKTCPPVALLNYSGFNVCFISIFISFILLCFVVLPFLSRSTKYVSYHIILFWIHFVVNLYLQLIKSIQEFLI